MCGGCATQHADERTQMAAKQRWLEDNLERIGKVRPETLLPMVYGPEWGYRRRARLSARHVLSRGGALVGFRERRSTHVADMRECHVLPQQLSQLIPELRNAGGKLSLRERVPQIEIAAGDNATALVFRHLQPLTEDDKALLKEFSETHGMHVWLQPGGPESAHPFHPAQSELYYELPEFGLRIHFRPTEFTQVNFAMNRVLVSRALRLLDPQPGERVADLFCGLGNFSCHWRRAARKWSGLKATGNWWSARAERRRQRPRRPVRGHESILFFHPVFWAVRQDAARSAARRCGRNREGAARRVAAAHRLRVVRPGDARARRRHPRHTKGFRLAAAGVVNMFPHTAHVESIAFCGILEALVRPLRRHAAYA